VQVFLLRHADAAQETLEMRDPHRHLTPTGRRQARDIGDRLRWHDCEPTHLWSSPLVRAIQTAELVAAGLHSNVAIEAIPALAPDENPRSVLAALAALPADAVVILVGHEPGLSAVGALLVGPSSPASARPRPRGSSTAPCAGGSPATPTPPRSSRSSCGLHLDAAPGRARGRVVRDQIDSTVHFVSTTSRSAGRLAV
jgi:phosphohistidine phosphatase